MYMYKPNAENFLQVINILVPYENQTRNRAVVNIIVSDMQTTIAYNFTVL